MSHSPPYPSVDPPLNPDFLFLEAIRNRRIPFTYVFLAANLLVFLLMTFSGGTMNEATLLAYGVKSNAAIDGGEIWRFVTPVFIHIGPLHLLLNSYALWIVGQQVERLYGSARFVTLYVLMGVAGVLGSYLYRPEALSAGASGAIFGLFGVLLVFGVRNRRTVPTFIRKAIGAGILPIIVLNLVIGSVIPAIDNAAHVGGLLAGIGLGTLFGFRAPGSRTPVAFRIAQWTSLALVAVCFQQAAARYDGPPPRLSNVRELWSAGFFGESAAERFIGAVNQAQAAVTASFRAMEADAAGQDWNQLQAGLDEAGEQLSRLSSLSAASDALIEEFTAVVEGQRQLIGEIGRDRIIDAERRSAAAANAAAHRSVYRRLLEWVEHEGARYGLEVRPTEGPGV